jgi:hypothetical protein
MPRCPDSKGHPPRSQVKFMAALRSRPCRGGAPALGRWPDHFGPPAGRPRKLARRSKCVCAFAELPSASRSSPARRARRQWTSALGRWPTGLERSTAPRPGASRAAVGCTRGPTAMKAAPREVSRGRCVPCRPLTRPGLISYSLDVKRALDRDLLFGHQALVDRSGLGPCVAEQAPYVLDVCALLE